jgi:hypothetical protein
MTGTKRKARGMPESVTQGVRLLGRVSGRLALVYKCRKAGGIIPLESPLEKTVAQLADLDPRVIGVKAQPFTIDVLTGAIFHTREDLLAGRKGREKNEVKKREYTPDLLLSLLDGRMVVVEVKHDGYMGPDDYWEKVDTAKEILRTSGYHFIVVTLDYEPHLPVVRNADLLTTFEKNYRGQLSLAQVEAVEKLLEAAPLQLGSLCKEINLNFRESPALLLSGLVQMDLTATGINAASLVTRAFGDLGHLAILPFYQEK